jgi:hypothetical protein
MTNAAASPLDGVTVLDLCSYKGPNAQIHTVDLLGCAGSRLPGEAGVAKTLMPALVCFCRVNLLNGSEH